MKKSIKNKAKPIMIQGTSSHAGKSIITAALCRILKKKGVKVAPFKAQNMALNSFVTKEGFEIGRAQAFQAEAAGIEPSADINPVLLKPTGESSAQVIIHGKVLSNMSAEQYHRFKKEARRFVSESYGRLKECFDVIVIEGAGNPAEVNLRENDIANMGVAEIAGSPVIIVGDIDRGGVFASIVGTMELLTEEERSKVKGFIINKFRGDMKLLSPGIDFLEERTGLPVLGVIPYIKEMVLPDEDGVAIEGIKSPSRDAESGPERIRVTVIRLPRISNFTDFDPFKYERDVELRFVENARELEGTDLVVIPGSKNTVEDLMWLKKNSFYPALKSHVEKGGMLAGICGGFQMLGGKIKDPHCVESKFKDTDGLKFMDMETTLERTKRTFQVRASINGLFEGSFDIRGYEIHMGETRGPLKPLATITERNSKSTGIEDGAVVESGSIWGTYIHGIFDNDGFRGELIGELRKQKGLSKRDNETDFKAMREGSIDGLAGLVEKNMDIDNLFNIIGLNLP